MKDDAFSQVTVVVVTYNSAHCLPMLAPLLSVCSNVVISDNGSDDDTVAKAKTLLPHAKVLAHGRNLGFGAANNRALALVNCTQLRGSNRSRGLVRCKLNWRSKYLCGQPNSKPKPIFLNKYESSQEGNRLQRKLTRTTTLALPLRVVLFSPKLVARMWGRWRGLLNWNAS